MFPFRLVVLCFCVFDFQYHSLTFRVRPRSSAPSSASHKSSWMTRGFFPTRSVVQCLPLLQWTLRQGTSMLSTFSPQWKPSEWSHQRTFRCRCLQLEHLFFFCLLEFTSFLCFGYIQIAEMMGLIKFKVTTRLEVINIVLWPRGRSLPLFQAEFGGHFGVVGKKLQHWSVRVMTEGNHWRGEMFRLSKFNIFHWWNR